MVSCVALILCCVCKGIHGTFRFRGKRTARAVTAVALAVTFLGNNNMEKEENKYHESEIERKIS